MTNWLDIGGGALLGLYAISLFIFDRFVATRPSRDLLLGYLATLKDGAGHQRPTDPNDRLAFDDRVLAINADIKKAVECVGGTSEHSLVRLIRPISVSKVLSMWREAHTLEERTWALATPAELTARLSTAASELKDFGKNKDNRRASVAIALADQISKALNPAPSPPTSYALTFKTQRWELQRVKEPKATSDQAKSDQAKSDSTKSHCALVQESIRFLYDQRDTKFQSLASRQTQSVWLAVFALALIVIAVLTAHRQAFFVYGALGAFISRLGRVQRDAPKEDDYGVSSGSLYLSLVAGAIGGWVGVLVVNALASRNVNVLGSAFDGIWNHPTHVLPAAVAVAFGFSERLLSKVIRQTGTTVSATTSSQGSTTT
jgi:hypothetical protein